MSKLQGDAPPGARPTVPSWRTRAVDALLPHRGAIANARAAVERDRVAVWQRRQAALAIARATGHPVASSR